MNPGLLIFLGTTISTSFCVNQPRCGENEMFYRTCAPCTKSCSNPDDMCLLMCAYNKCDCKPGFPFRDSQGKCTNDCSSEPCWDPNAVRKSCGLSSLCKPSCSNPNPASLIPFCNNKSYCAVPSACECKPGYVLEDLNNRWARCVPISSCGRPTNFTVLQYS
uniref:Trypsin inhibitor-like protein 1 precusor n=1 Tax=Ancylostoma duodenale TaxID=51022 RepID=E3TMR6_9BILA|nr:trypsin inhibitor-like protein 1 precusor [Ancylostoma duodenale]